MKKVKKVMSIILILVLTILPLLPILNVKAEDELTITTYGENEDGINPNLVTNTATLTVENVTNEDILTAYKIIDTFYNESTNEVTYEFTNNFQSFLEQSTKDDYKNMTIEDYFNLTSDIEDNSQGDEVITTSTLNVLVSNYTTYIRNNDTITGSDMTTTETTATKELPAGAYLIIPKTVTTIPQEDADYEVLGQTRNIYGVMVGNLVITVDENTNQWTLTGNTIYAKKDDTYNVTAILNTGIEDMMNGTVSDIIFNENISSSYTQKHIYWNELWLPYLPTNAINKTAKVEIQIPEGISYNQDEIYMMGDGLTSFTDGKMLDDNGNTIATISFEDQKITIIYNREYIEKEIMNVAFDVELNSNANVGVLGNEIISVSTITDDPYVENSTTVMTAKNIMTTYGLELTSFNNDNTAQLKGAKYEVYTSEDLAADSLLGEFEVGEDGVGTFAGVAEGTVYLKQTKAPTGYQLIKDVIPVKIAIEDSVDTDNDYYYEVTTSNQKMWFLPSTGGAGTIIYTLIGLGIIIASSIGIIYYRKKKENNTKNK